jgi:hypothetical protein
MAHCAEIIDGVVVRVIVVSNEYEPNVEAWATQWAGGGEWKQTSYNGNIRYNYAGIGYTYDPIDDAFIAPAPCEHDELLLNDKKQWECANEAHTEAL